MHFVILWVKWGFWAITLVPDMLEGLARSLSTREIIYVPTNVSAKILAHGIGVQGPSKLVKKNENTPLCEPMPGEPLTHIKNKINRTKKTCCIRRGFEQLSSYSGWRVITKKARVTIVARVVVKGFVYLKASKRFWKSLT